MTVVRDDADALIAWLPAGTPVLQVARADGRGKRDDKSTLFTAEPVQSNRSMARKDEDELALAVEQGRFDATTAAAIEGEATEIEAIVREWGSPFCDGWEHFRPDPAWPLPDLATHTR